MPDNEMLTLAKLAKQWGVSEKAVKDAAEKSGLAPDALKGKCKLYAPATAAQIKKLVTK